MRITEWRNEEEPGNWVCHLPAPPVQSLPAKRLVSDSLRGFNSHIPEAKTACTGSTTRRRIRLDLRWEEPRAVALRTSREGSSTLFMSWIIHQIPTIDQTSKLSSFDSDTLWFETCYKTYNKLQFGSVCLRKYVNILSWLPVYINTARLLSTVCCTYFGSVLHGCLLR